LREDYNEIDPEGLFDLPANTKIAYVRRDNGKHVFGALIVKHMVSKKGKALTMLAFPPPSAIRIGPKAASSGVVRVGAYGPMRFFITPADLRKLYVSANPLDQIASLSARVAELEALALSAAEVIKSMEARLNTIEPNLQLTATHVLKQKNIIEAFAQRLVGERS